MRDKRKSEAYFKEYLEYQDERIENFTNRLESLPASNVLGQQRGKMFLAGFYSDKIVAMYSDGCDLDEIKKVYTKYVSYFLDSVTTEESYYMVVQCVALGVLLNVETELVEKLNTIVEKSGVEDGLLELMLGYLNEKEIVDRKVCRIKEYEELLKDSGDTQIQHIAEFLKHSWYRLHKDADWYDSHKSKNDTYCGYWSFEIAAVVKIRKLNDDQLQEAEYYPYDLAHFEG